MLKVFQVVFYGCLEVSQMVTPLLNINLDTNFWILKKNPEYKIIMKISTYFEAKNESAPPVEPFIRTNDQFEV